MNTSSKTPNSATAKTASAPRLFIALGLLTAVAAVAMFAPVRMFHRPVPARVQLVTAYGTYDLQVVSTARAQQQGLGGRRSMPANTGMLFWFTSDDQHCFWMKDMHFPLDIIWLNAHKRVVHIEPSLSPASYPKAFCPPAASRYVIELNAGQAARAGVVEGEALTF